MRKVIHRIARMRSFALALGITFVLNLPAVGAEDPVAGGFSRIVLPSGWTVPHHGKLLRSGVFSRLGLPDGITFSEFAPSATRLFFLPRYYIDHDSLVLLSLKFRASTITRLDAGGAPFAWLVGAIGADTGLSANVWILDREGDGRLVELEWNPDFTHLPAWVMQRLAALEQRRPRHDRPGQ
jgi:hypothetical protein